MATSVSHFKDSMCAGSGWKGLTAARRAAKELAESEAAEGRIGCGLGRRSSPLIFLLSPLFDPLSSQVVSTRSSTIEPVHRLF